MLPLRRAAVQRAAALLRRLALEHGPGCAAAAPSPGQLAAGWPRAPPQPLTPSAIARGLPLDGGSRHAWLAWRRQHWAAGAAARPGDGARDAPAAAAASAAPAQVLVPPETEIPVPFDTLLQRLQGDLALATGAAPAGADAPPGGRDAADGGGGAAAAAALGRVGRHLENIAHWRSLRLGKQLKASFAAACAAAEAAEAAAATGTGPAPARRAGEQEEQHGPQGPEQGPGQAAEQAFLSEFFALMGQARYQLLTRQQWAVAQSDQFTFDIPVRIRTNSLDAGWLRSFWAAGEARAAQRGALPDLSDHILIFHRGIGVARARGYCVNEKVDLLVHYALYEPILKLSRCIREYARSHLAGGSVAAGGEAGVGVPVEGGGPGSGSDSGGGSGVGGGGGGCTMFDSSHRRSEAVERRTLRSLLPGAGAVLRHLFSEIELQEPTFKNVVVVYKRAGEAPPATASERAYAALAPLSTAAAARGLRAAPISIKSFQDIPLADAELCFPDKSVHLKPFVFVRMLAAAAGAAAAGWLAWSKGGGTLSRGLAGSLATLLGGRAMSLLTTVFYHRARMAGEMERMQYNHARDSREGFLAKLLDDMASQAAKEDAAAYAILLISQREGLGGTQPPPSTRRRRQLPASGGSGGGPLAWGMTRDELDDACEDFLERAFGADVDFILDDSLARLLEWGLVVPVGGTDGGGHDGSGDGGGGGAQRYAAVPLAEAELRLETAWRETQLAPRLPPPRAPL